MVVVRSNVFKSDVLKTARDGQPSTVMLKGIPYGGGMPYALIVKTADIDGAIRTTRTRLV